jgi:hypothetical protein
MREAGTFAWMGVDDTKFTHAARDCVGKRVVLLCPDVTGNVVTALAAHVREQREIPCLDGEAVCHKETHHVT